MAEGDVGKAVSMFRVWATSYIALAGVIAGCTMPPPPPATPPTAVTVQPAGGEPGKEMEGVVNAPCKLSTDTWGMQGEGKLRFAHDTPPFVAFGSGKVNLALISSSAGIETRVELRGVTLRGAMTAKDVGLFIARPVLFGGIAIPMADTAVHWTRRMRNERFEVVHEIDTAQETVLPLMGTAACGDLALDPTEDEVSTWLTDGKRGTNEFLGYAIVEVSSTPTGPVVAALDVDHGLQEVIVIDRRDSRVQIVWPRMHEVIRGWVTEEAVQPKLDQDDLAETFGVGGLGLYGVGGASYWTCPNRLALFAKQKDIVREVGHIEANTRVAMGVVREGFRDVSIEFTHRSFEPAEGVTFLVEEKSLDACTN